MRIFKKNNPWYALITRPLSVVAIMFKPHDRRDRLELTHYQEFPFDNQTIVHNRINNPTFIHTALNSIPLWHKHHAPVYVALDESHLTEKIITLAQPHLNQGILMQQSSEQLIWYTHYLHPHDDGIHHTWYTCALTRSFRTQWSLIAWYQKRGIPILTSSWSAHYALYKKIHGATHRQSKLAEHLTRADYRFSSLISHEMIHQMVHIPHHFTCTKEMYHNLTTAVGLYELGKTDEHH